MPRKRFLNYLTESIDKAKLRKMGELMELNEEESIILLDRFCDNRNVDQIASHPYNISPDRQRRIAPILECKIISWIVDNQVFFTKYQLTLISPWLPHQ